MKSVTRFLIFSFVVFLSSCGGSGDTSPASGTDPNGDTGTAPVPSDGDWTWISGSAFNSSTGVYGTKGVTDAANVPGARDGSVAWTDANGNLWFFGGNGYSGSIGKQNDLWRWDGSSWTWISGENVAEGRGNYGTRGVVNTNNVPGARYGAVSWYDGSGNAWLFGGYGVDSAGSSGWLNDLWFWDGSNWTWISGSNLVAQIGSYGTRGIADATNVPGARRSPVSWLDANGDLWLFGGFRGEDATTEEFNDLWRWNGTNWTWVSGSNLTLQPGVYGTQGIAESANVPGARGNATSWIDANGHFWLFGGRGYDSIGGDGLLNDLWRWDGSNWTWISGNNLISQAGIYGTQGVAASDNAPGARQRSISWISSDGNLWLFGGITSAIASSGRLNDLWRWDGANWTWISGGNVVDQSGIYGTKNIADPANVPGARNNPVAWIDASGNLWLFGGHGFDSSGPTARLNDLWRYGS